MNTDPRPFIAAALSGLMARPIHDQAGPIDPKTKEPTIIRGASGEAIGKRAVEAGVAAAAAFDTWQAEHGDDAPPAPAKRKG